MTTTLTWAGLQPPIAAATSRFVFLSLSALDLLTLRRRPDAETVADEVRICIEQLRVELGARGLSRYDVAKVTVWISEEQYRIPFQKAYRELMAPGPFPSRGLFVTGLLGGCNIQIDAIVENSPETEGVRS